MTAFRIDQVTPGAGTAGQSRHDLIAGEVITLTATSPSGGGVTYTWEILDKVGSNATLSSGTGTSVTIGNAGAVTQPCAFLIRCTSNDAGTVDYIDRIASVRTATAGLRLPLFPETAPRSARLASYDADDSTDNAVYSDRAGLGASQQNWRGWAEWAYELTLAVEAGGGGGSSLIPRLVVDVNGTIDFGEAVYFQASAPLVADLPTITADDVAAGRQLLVALFFQTNPSGTVTLTPAAGSDQLGLIGSSGATLELSGSNQAVLLQALDMSALVSPPAIYLWGIVASYGVGGSGSGITDGDKGDVTVGSSGTVWTIDAGVVTLAKMTDIASDRIIGRDTAGAGVPEALTVGGGLEFTGSGGIQRSALTGDVTATAGSGTTTIANDAVTNAKAANMAEATVKGRAAGTGTGDPTDLTSTQLRAIIDGTPPGVETVSTTTYNVVAADAGKIKRFTHASGCAITVPSGLGSIFVGFIAVQGAGSCSVVPSSTTINGAGSTIVFSDAPATATLVPTGSADVFDLVGNIGSSGAGGLTQAQVLARAFGGS